MTIYINNAKTDSFGIYVGRGRGSILGNPFSIGKDGSREEVIRLYRIWLWDEFNKKADVFYEIQRLTSIYEETGHLSLLCWCAPLPCHAEVIRACILWLAHPSYN